MVRCTLTTLHPSRSLTEVPNAHLAGSAVYFNPSCNGTATLADLQAHRTEQGTRVFDTLSMPADAIVKAGEALVTADLRRA